MHKGSGRSWLSTGLAATGALLLFAGLVAWGQAPTGGSPDISPEQTAASATTPAPAPVRVERTPGAPRRVLIPSLGVAAPVVPVRALNDTLIPPADADRLGWWADGAAPGAARGSALVAGHTLQAGEGALQDLEELTRGQPIMVHTDGGPIHYQVARVRVYDKGRLARHAERVFSQEVAGRLVLITCEDWDGSRYLSNVVVIARPVAD